MPLELIIREGDGPERRQVVAKQAAVMGRREDNDVVLPFSFVSARHGRVFVRDGLVHVEDMGSTNGTLVNGTPLEPMVPRLLGPDDLVEIDRLALRARWVEEAPAEGGPPTWHEPVVSRALAPIPPASAGAPAGVWEIQAGAPPAAPPPVVAVEARPVAPPPVAPPGPFAASRTLAREPRLEGSGRLRLWALALQLAGVLAVLGGLVLLLAVLLA